MQKAVFKTFAVTEGLMEILKSSFLALMLALRANAIEPSQNAKVLTRRLQNKQEVSCCELKSEYRKMALQLHPDKGGSDEDMVHLNNARDSRKDCSKRKMRGCSLTSSKGTKSKSSTGTKSKSSTKSSKGTKSKSSTGTKSKSSTKSSKGTKGTKKTKKKSVDRGRLFAGGVLAGGVVGIVANAMGKRKSHKPHVRTPTSPRHK